MVIPLQKNEPADTYFMENWQHEADRLTLQDHMVTRSMGGVLPEQEEPEKLQRILDVACGTGAWAREAARTYPTMSLFGVDRNQRLIDYARERAEAEQVAERVEFHMMNVVPTLEFPDGYLDLANLRFGGSFLRTWDWPQMIREMIRVVHDGGTVRISDAQVGVESSSPALMKLYETLCCAFHEAGHLYENESTGLIAHFERLLSEYGCKQVQTKEHRIEYRATGDKEAYASYYADMQSVFQAVRPFIARSACLPQNYDEIYQQALSEMQQPEFYALGTILIAWGLK